MIKEQVNPRFHETDALGHINNTTVPRWFEGARDAVFRWFTPDLDTRQWKLILARFDVEFHDELLYEHPVELRTSISRIGTSSFDVYQEAWQREKRCASGTTVLVHYDHKLKKSIPLTEEILVTLNSHLRRVE